MSIYMTFLIHVNMYQHNENTNCINLATKRSWELFPVAFLWMHSSSDVCYIITYDNYHSSQE